VCDVRGGEKGGILVLWWRGALEEEVQAKLLSTPGLCPYSQSMPTRKALALLQAAWCITL
jgi:hypothetical protein